ncbi:MAG: type II toxin-antitoxin system HicA family toxin [Pseudomonadota bacterium]|nr:type II toxin-antitoxin system HicA family toxin [Pseudomonadota bacterium]
MIKVLRSDGFVFISQRGSHIKYRKTGDPTLTVIIPAGRKEIPRGTLRSILRQAGLDESTFDDRASS